jgi:flavine halogenase
VVRNQEAYNQKEQSLLSPFPSSAAANPTNSTLVARYLASLALAPGILKLITENGIMDTGSVKSASDFSYSAPLYAGNGFRIVGDAGGSISFHLFSSGD